MTLLLALAINVSEEGGGWARCNSPPRSSYCAAPDILGATTAPTAEILLYEILEGQPDTARVEWYYEFVWRSGGRRAMLNFAW